MARLVSRASILILSIVICCSSCACEASEAKTKKILPVPMPLCTSWNQTCLEAAAMMGLKYLCKPNARLPSVDPLHVERIHVRPNLNSTVCYTQDYYNMEFHGMSNALVKNFTVAITPTQVSMNFSLFMDTFKMISWYRWNGTVLGQRVNGYGRGNITSANVTHVHMLTLRRKSNDRMSLDEYAVDLQPTELFFDMENMVKGDPDASKRTETFFNKHGMQIFKAVKQDYDRVFAKVSYPYVCAFFRNLRLQDLFLDAPK